MNVCCTDRFVPTSEEIGETEQLEGDQCVSDLSSEEATALSHSLPQWRECVISLVCLSFWIYVFSDVGFQIQIGTWKPILAKHLTLALLSAHV